MVGAQPSEEEAEKCLDVRDMASAQVVEEYPGMVRLQADASWCMSYTAKSQCLRCASHFCQHQYDA